MKISGNTVLITGGATGIGIAVADAFMKAGNEVLICGRRESKLKQAQARLPHVHTLACDISNEEGRKYLLDRVSSDYGNTNVLINNAGIQRAIDFRKGPRPLLDGENEIDINLKGPIYLSAHFIPLLMKRKEAAIVNVSSGLAFMPISFMPVYCATKAGLHSFTLSLRHQLKNTSIKVFELIPPRVDTELGLGPDVGRERAQTYGGIQAVQVSGALLTAMEKDEYEIAVAGARDLISGSRKDPDKLFQNMNGR